MLGNRDELWHSLSSDTGRQWDMIIVGGGITGAGVLREAVRQGWNVLLIEQNDFAWGTSSRSSKMVHGGLRYLAQGDLSLTRHSLKERERLLSEAPGLVERMGYYLMLNRGRFPGRLAMSLVLSVYDFIAGLKPKQFKHRYLKRQALSGLFPGLDHTGLRGASYYSDAVTDDARLVLRVLHEGVAQGGNVLNYVKASQLLDNDCQQIRIENTQTGESKTLQASVIVNATGGWADQLRQQVSRKKHIRPLRGSHLVISREKLPLSEVVSVYHPEDNRPVFIFPWDGTIVIGTTDLDHPDDLGKEPSITSSELDYLLAIIHHQFPGVKVGYEDIISTFSGVRPVIASKYSKDPSKERRDHALWRDNRLITVSGGKLTTFRLIALDVIKAACKWLPHGGAHADDRVFKKNTHSAQDLATDDARWARRLLGRYGDHAASLLTQATDLERNKIANTQYCLAECRWALQHESVIHLDDLLLRRTRLGLLLKNGAEELFTELQEMCCAELGWDNKRWQSERYRYQRIISQYYSIPESV